MIGRPARPSHNPTVRKRSDIKLRVEAIFIISHSFSLSSLLLFLFFFLLSLFLSLLFENLHILFFRVFLLLGSWNLKIGSRALSHLNPRLWSLLSLSLRSPFPNSSFPSLPSHKRRRFGSWSLMFYHSCGMDLLGTEREGERTKGPTLWSDRV